MIGLGMGLWRGQIIAQRWDDDALAYIAQVETADGQPLEPKVKLAINRLVRQCKRDASPVAGRSNWQSLKASCLLAGPRTLAGALVPLRGPAPTNINFVSGDYSATGGLKSATTSKKLEVSALEYDMTDVHISTYAMEGLLVPFSESFIGLGGAGHTVIYRDNETVDSAPIPHIAYRCSASEIDRVYLGGSTDDFTKGFFGVGRSSQDIMNYATPTLDGSTTRNTTMTQASYVLTVFGPNPSFWVRARLSFYSAGDSVDLVALRGALDTYMEAIS